MPKLALDARVALDRWYQGMTDSPSQVVMYAENLIQQNKELERLLLDVEGSLLAYWTDISQEEIQRLTVAIRTELGN